MCYIHLCVCVDMCLRLFMCVCLHVFACVFVRVCVLHTSQYYFLTVQKYCIKTVQASWVHC